VIRVALPLRNIISASIPVIDNNPVFSVQVINGEFDTSPTVNIWDALDTLVEVLSAFVVSDNSVYSAGFTGNGLPTFQLLDDVCKRHAFSSIA
jgi:hypothetical protein